MSVVHQDSAFSAALPSPVVAGRYRLLREIGSGGAGSVHEARHLVTGRHVALKRLASAGERDPHARARLELEARALGAVSHPSVVGVLDAALDPPFLAMELVAGRTLEGVITARGRLDVATTLAVGTQLATALVFVHVAGYVHRDVKPSNVMLLRDATAQDDLRLVDFGIAAPRGDAAALACGASVTEGILGTPEYMPPERLILRSYAEPSADVWAVGAVLFECLTGAVPFQGELAHVITAVTSRAAEPLRHRCPDAPASLERLVAAALDREPSRRPTMAALRAALADVATEVRGAAASSARADERLAPAEVARRGWQRAPYAARVRLADAEGRVMIGRSEDVSPGGMMVVVREPSIAAASIASVGFALPRSGLEVQLPVVARWARDARGRRAVGLQFVEPPPEIVRVLAAFVAAGGRRDE